MAGIKRKSAVSTASDAKSKSKKVKVDKPAAKGSSKHEVKPVKKTKKAKAESSDEIDESDTSEQENGFHGFSANDDTAMDDVESSDGAEPMEDVKQDGKAHKRKSEGDAPDSKLAELNGMHFNPRLSRRG
jgi:pumilio family protein 6